ncbi:protein RETICULATA-RELATED 5, chloroplastic [Cryptomeria japonica]|uniref:protein RETICULATA-RELATED 5, chloroplastic n=1 Tax=Cryptomeria japonica TaxID=3369 RepID=UPI0027DA31EC|nr:protein RETICULATA-RELATED 5, chloroplastic [Cryptomeria japonica]
MSLHIQERFSSLFNFTMNMNMAQTSLHRLHAPPCCVKQQDSQVPGYHFQAKLINEKPASIHSYRSKRLTKTRPIRLRPLSVCKNSHDHETSQNNSTPQETGTRYLDSSNIDNSVCSSRREAILKPLLTLGICSMHSIAKAEIAQLDSVKNPEHLGLDKKVDTIKEPEKMESNTKKLASMESNISNSRIYDATVIGEPVAIGKDRQRVWNKLLGARIVYLGEAEYVPDPDDKAIELEIVQNLRDNCFEQERPISLALQAFPSNLQSQLNEYMNQRINVNDLKSFISHWPVQQWEEYKPLLQYCCTNGVRLIACGAPLEILRTVESEGIQGLTMTERRKYVPPLGAGFIANFSSISRKLQLNGVFPQASFSFGPGSYLFAQARMVEDFTMSQIITQAMMDGGSVGLLVVITGASHVLLGTRGGGLPARISKKLPKKTQVVVLLNPERQHIRKEGEVPIADFLWYKAAKLCTRNCFDRVEIARIMDAAGRRRDALPQDLQKGLDLGLVSPEVLQKFLDLDKQPFIAELIHHFQGFRERWLADPRFLQRLALEETICITATLIAQYEKRKERFIEELDYVISDSLRSAVVSFFAVWLPAPTLSFISYEEKIGTSGIMDGLKGLLGSLPDNAFQRNGLGKSWDLRARMTAVVMGGMKLFCVGFVSSIATVSVTNTLFTIRQQWRTGVARNDVKTKSPVLKTALVYGSFLGTSANLRYQFVAGIVEHWGADYVLASQPFLGNVVSFLARVINSYFGTRQWIDLARLTGLQQSKAEPEKLSCKPLNHPPEQLEGEK